MIVSPRIMMFMRQWRAWLDVLGTVSIIVVCLSMTWVTLSQPARRASAASSPSRSGVNGPTARDATARQDVVGQLVSLKGSTFKGSLMAQVVLIEYSDFQCPYCARFATQVWPKLRESYVTPGKVLVAFKHLPLERIHPFAMRAAHATECAKTQGRFWEMHDFLFSQYRSLHDKTIYSGFKAFGLDDRRFAVCMQGEAPARLRVSVAEATELGITGTPTFLIGLIQSDARVKVTNRMTGARTIEEFASVIDPLLRK